MSTPISHLSEISACSDAVAWVESTKCQSLESAWKKCEPMKPIPKVFRKDGITRTLVRRVGAVALYELTRPHWRQSFWEVMVIRRRAASRRPIPASGGSPARFVDCPASERLPATTEWGMAGWSLSTREQADRTFRKVLALRSEKEAISP